MFFAVFSEDAIVYLGADPTESAEAFRSKGGVKLEYAATMEELKDRFDAHVGNYNCGAQSCEEEVDLEEIFSSALETVLEKLDDMGLNPDNAEYCADKVKEKGKKVVKNVRHLGHKMMKTAGENFIWLGDLLKEEAEKSDTNVDVDLTDIDESE